jgi:hypothetical protein
LGALAFDIGEVASATQRHASEKDVLTRRHIVRRVVATSHSLVDAAPRLRGIETQTSRMHFRWNHDSLPPKTIHRADVARATLNGPTALDPLAALGRVLSQECLRRQRWRWRRCVADGGIPALK